MSPRREAALLTLTTVALLAPFLGKPFHVDDPLFVWLAQHVQAHPLSFYGFQVNWDGVAQPMYEVTKNPPLAGYLLAGAAAVVGFREWALHAAFLVPAVAAVLGTWAIARRLCAHAFEAGLLAVATPVFLVSATSVMCDVTALALYTWALAAWLAGIERERLGWLVASGILAAAAALTKYFGVTVVGLCFVSGWLVHRRLGRWCLPLLIPVAAVALYEAFTFATYGRPLLSEAAGFAERGGFIGKPPLFVQATVGLSFLGACMVPWVFYGPFLWPKRALAAAAVLAGPIAWLLDGVLRPVPGPEDGLPPIPMPVEVELQLVLAAFAGAALLAAGALDPVRRRDHAGILLALWLGGTFVFASFVNWTNNGRSILPLLPAAAILLVRRLEGRFPSPGPRLRTGLRLAFAPGLAVALAVAWADARWAHSVRDEAERLLARHHSSAAPLRFDGHWGFQYYLERGGARPLEMSRGLLREGDRIAVALNNVPQLPPGGPFERIETSEGSEPRWLRTQSWRMGAGFYASAFGPLPYAFGRGQPDRYEVYRVRRSVHLYAAPTGEVRLELLPRARASEPAVAGQARPR